MHTEKLHIDGDQKKNSPANTIEAILHNYIQMERSLVEQLNFEVPSHSPTIGGFREEIWKQLFEQIVPKKYAIAQSVFIIDSTLNVSAEVDLAIFDEMYTPYIFRNGRIKFIPIEAVAAVIQCKSTNVDNKVESKDETGNSNFDAINSNTKYILKEWCKSIDRLNTSGNSIARIASNISQGPIKTQSGTRPIKILCALKQPNRELMREFDFYIIVDKNKFADKINVFIPHEKDWDLSEWHYDLNMRGKETASKFEKKMLEKKLSDYTVECDGQPVALLTLNFQPNQLLMLINNPMPFPHKAYADMFNAVYSQMDHAPAKKNNQMKEPTERG